MNYTEEYCQVRNSLLANKKGLSNLSEVKMSYLEGHFHSDFSVQLNASEEGNPHKIFSDSKVNMDTNTNFKYPVIRPENAEAKQKAIILLHGLNERSWDKYLPWAYSLAQQTGKSIILFPIAYHMNRSPESWKNPREMNAFVDKRSRDLPGLNTSSFLNVALSERLTDKPQRFFLSGYQAAHDILKLMDELKAGENPLFAENTEVDFFAYSIGVLLSQVLLLANPGNRFDTSRFFFFCGGSVLEGMQGESKYILDNKAFERLSGFYNSSLETESNNPGIFDDLLSETQLGQSFLNLTSFSRLNEWSQKFIKRIREQVQTICLKKDRIMPSGPIKRTMAGTNVLELDFPYPYSHELPFPLSISRNDTLIDKAFAQVFRRAGAFLCT